MKVLDVKQGTCDWFMARAGIVTGSKAADVMDFLKKGGESQKRANYRAQIIAELLTGQPFLDGYLSPEMEWGNQNESFARATYELEQDMSVDLLGFALHDSVERMGGSPDGLVGSDGGIEIKCPKTSTHIRWMLEGKVPEEHQPQMDFYMAVTGRQWWDFASYDPRLPAELRFFVIRRPRDEARIAEIEAAVVKFNAEVDETIARLKELVGAFELPKRLVAKARVEEAQEAYLTDAEIERYI